jgi:Mg2+ and Co2+ transporter CorA
MPNSSLIPSTWSSFPEEFRERLGSNAGRQRTMIFEDHLLVVAHHVPEHDEVSRRGVLFWLDPSGEWRASNGDPGKAALALHLDRYSKRIEHYESEETKATKADDFLPILDGLVPLVRSTKNLLAALEDARKAFPKERSIIDHRDKAYELTRQAELLYEDAKNSMEVALIRRADEQTAATHQMTVAAHRLNMLVAIFFPMATLGSIFGTTLTDNWTWSKSPIGFFVFLVVGFLCGLGLIYFVSRPAKKNPL